jgi:hypothetical protein
MTILALVLILILMISAIVYIRHDQSKWVLILIACTVWIIFQAVVIGRWLQERF